MQGDTHYRNMVRGLARGCVGCIPCRSGVRSVQCQVTSVYLHPYTFCSTKINTVIVRKLYGVLFLNGDEL